nr:hypothetical protein [uncultured archaeon]
MIDNFGFFDLNKEYDSKKSDEEFDFFKKDSYLDKKKCFLIED